MSKISISRSASKPNHPRYYITDGREPLGTIFESKGVFSAVDPSGNLVAGSTSLKNAVHTLCVTGPST
jgi:hypothetical protein